MSEDPKAVAAEERKRPEVDRMLRQFLRLESGLGNSRGFQRGWVFAYEFTQEQKDRVNRLMEEGKSFEEAFDEVRG